MASDVILRFGARFDDLQRAIKKQQRQLNRFADFAEQVGTRLSTRLTLPIVGAGTATVTSFAKFEKLELGLKAIVDEGEDAGETLSRLQKIAQLPGISLEQAVKGANQLRNVGFEAQQAEAILTELSKAVTLSGEGPQQLQAVVRQLVQMSAKGRILQEDLGVIQENVPSIGIAIQDAFGTQNIEAIRATGVSAQEFTARITQAISENEKFQNVQGGLANEFDNFNQSVQISLATLGRTIAESINLSGILQSLSSFIGRVTARFKELSPGVQRFIVIAAGVAAAIGPVVLGFGAFIKVIGSVIAAVKLVGGALAILAANPIGLTIAAIGGLVIAFKRAFDGSSKFRAVVLGIIEVIKVFGQKALEAITLPVKIFGDLLRGDLKAAGERIKSLFGSSPGREAGEAFAKAYNESIANTAARNNSGGRIGASGRGSTTAESSTANLSAVFANLPTAAPQLKETAEAAKEVEINFERIARVTPNLAPDGLLSNLSSLDGLISVNASNLQGYSSFVGAYVQEIDAATERNSVLGDSFSLLSEKIRITRGALTEAIDNFGVNSAEVEELRSRYTALNEELDGLNARQERIGAFVGVFEEIGEAVGSLAEQGKLSFKSFAKAAVGALSEVIAALIRQGVAAAVANAFRSPLGIVPGVGLALAAGAGAAASGLFKGLINSLPGLNQGGIIPPGFEGDSFLARLNSNEAVIPLDRLFRELGGGGGEIRGIVRGADLLLIQERAQYNRSRITGG